MPTEEVLKLLKNYLQIQTTQRDGLRKKYNQGGNGVSLMKSLVDKKNNYSYKKRTTPDMKKVVLKFRQNLSGGGSAIDEQIYQTQMLIGALEGTGGPTNWLEADTLQDLKKELEKLLKIGN